MLTKCILYDLKTGFYYQWKKYAILIVITLISCLDCYRLCLQNSIALPTIWDYVLWNFRGMAVIQSTDTFIIPNAYWVLLNMFLAIIIGHYPVQDLHQVGQLRLMKSGRRSTWILGKVAWNMVSVIAFYTIIFLVISIMGIFTGGMGRPQLEVLSFVLGERISIADKGYLLYGILMPIMISIGVSQIQMAIAIVLKPMLGYIFIAVFLSTGIFIYHPLSLGNYLMTLRLPVLLTDSVLTLKTGILLSMGIATGCIVIVYLIFLKKDIFSK